MDKRSQLMEVKSVQPFSSTVVEAGSESAAQQVRGKFSS